MTPLHALAADLLLWLGLLLGISFLEAPVKFQAASLRRNVALDVGRHVFRASQWVQLALGAIALAIFVHAGAPRAAAAWLGGLAVLLLVQELWLRPALDRRILFIFQGGQPRGAGLHGLYIAADVGKAALLGTAAFQLLGA